MNKTDTLKFKRGQKVVYTSALSTFCDIGKITCTRKGIIYVKFGRHKKQNFYADEANTCLRIIE